MNANLSIAQMAMVNDQIAPEDFDESPPPHDGANGTKRKADDGSQTQQRAKRNRYISIACNEANNIFPATTQDVTNMKRSASGAR